MLKTFGNKNPARCPHRTLPLLVVVGSIWLAGCGSGHIPDPNDPADVPRDAVAKVLRSNLQVASDEINRRVLNGEITDEHRKKILANFAAKELTEGDPQNCAPADAWIYADLMITAGQYAEAIPELKRAIEYAIASKNDDRRVNDTLRMARCLAETGKVKEGLDLAQKLIDSKPKDPGPVLPSVLLEIAPAARGKGSDPELAHLLEESIHEHLRMKVDPNSEAGKAFLMARPHHILHAWRMIEELFEGSGHHEDAMAAVAKEEKMIDELRGEPVKNI